MGLAVCNAPHPNGLPLEKHIHGSLTELHSSCTLRLRCESGKRAGSRCCCAITRGGCRLLALCSHVKCYRGAGQQSALSYIPGDGPISGATSSRTPGSPAHGPRSTARNNSRSCPRASSRDAFRCTEPSAFGVPWPPANSRSSFTIPYSVPTITPVIAGLHGACSVGPPPRRSSARLLTAST